MSDHLIVQSTQGQSTQPTVAIWRTEWLAPSETFIRDQTASLQRWQPVRTGLVEVRPSIDRADVLPFGSVRSGVLARVLARGPWTMRRLAAELRDRNVRLIHAHFGPDGIRARPLAVLLGVPLVVTFHGYDTTELATQDTRYARHYRKRLKQLFTQATTLIAVSEFIAQRLRELGAPADKVVVRPIGIPIPAGIDQHPAGLPPTGLVFAGRLVQKKGVADLLEAVSRLPEQFRDVPVSIIGFGSLREELAATAERLGVAVRFHGRLSSTEIAEVFRAHAIFCGPSRWSDSGDAEGFGIVFLEAAAQALPVISYRHGGVPEAVVDGETGLLVNEGDVAALSAAIQTLLADPQRAAALGRRGQQRVIAEFDMRQRALELEACYDEAVSKYARALTH